MKTVVEKGGRKGEKNVHLTLSWQRKGVKKRTFSVFKAEKRKKNRTSDVSLFLFSGKICLFWGEKGVFCTLFVFSVSAIV